MSNEQGQQSEQVRAAQLQVGGQATHTRKETALQAMIDRLQRQNSEVSTLLLQQRDDAVRVTGVNPVEEPTPSDSPEEAGDIANLNAAILAHNELLTKLRSLSNHWSTL